MTIAALTEDAAAVLQAARTSCFPLSVARIRFRHKDPQHPLRKSVCIVILQQTLPGAIVTSRFKNSGGKKIRNRIEVNRGSRTRATYAEDRHGRNFLLQYHHQSMTEIPPQPIRSRVMLLERYNSLLVLDIN